MRDGGPGAGAGDAAGADAGAGAGVGAGAGTAAASAGAPVIRRATEGDAAAIAAIYNDAVERTTATFDTVCESPDARRAWLDEHRAPQHPVLVAERDGAVVGWAALSRYSTRCAYEATVELSVYVDASARGAGLGPLLTAAVLEAGRAGGVRAVLARVCTENDASLRMLARLGFFEVGVMREVGAKFGRTLDVALLEALLEPLP